MTEHHFWRIVNLTLSAVKKKRKAGHTMETQTGLDIEMDFSIAAYKLSNMEKDRADNDTAGNLEEILYEDPYRIMDIIPWYSMKRMEETAKRLNLDPRHTSRVKAGIRQELVKAQLRDGHSWLPHNELFSETGSSLKIQPDADIIPKSMRSLVDDGKCNYQKNDDGVYMVATGDMFKMEKRISDEFGKGFKPSPHFSQHKKENIDKIIESSELTEEQASAVRTAVASGICVISGVAGSGKSYVIGAIAAVMGISRLSVAMSAPTGKAARRNGKRV